MPWGPMEELSALFAPGMRHVQEEKQRRLVLRDDDGDGDDDGRTSTVDLDNKKAVIRLPAKPAE